MTRPKNRSAQPRTSFLLRLGAVSAGFLVFLTLPIAPLPRLGGSGRHERLALRFAPSGGIQWLSPKASSKGFRMLGVSWPGGETPGDGSLSMRTSTDGSRWSGWTALETSDIGPDSKDEQSDVRSTEPVWVGKAKHAQIKWLGTGRPPTNATLHLLDPGPDPSTPASAAQAAPGTPGIISRAQWGADESLRKCCTSYASTVRFAVVHHTATSNSYGAGESPAIVRSIYRYHIEVSGFDDIGYSFVVDKYGKIFEGRAGGVRSPVVGAHSEGFNTGSTGVSLMGTHQSTDPTGAAMTSLRNLLAWKLDLHHVNPKGSLTVVSGGSDKYPAGRSVTIPTIVGHRDVQSTQCPGDRVMSRLGGLRNDVYNHGWPKIFNPTISSSRFTPNGDGSNDTIRLRASTVGAGSWRLRIRNSAGSQVRSWSGTGNPDVSWDGRDSAGQPSPHGNHTVEMEASAGPHIATPAKVGFGLFRDPWSAWSSVGGLLDQRTATRVGARNGQFHALARANDGAVYHSQWGGSAWGSIRRVGGTSGFAAAGRMGLAADGAGALHAVIRGTNSNIYHARIEPNGKIGGWSRIGGAGSRGRDVTVVADNPGVIHVMVVGMDGSLYWNRYRSGGWNSSWTRVGPAGSHGTKPTLAAGRSGDVLATIIGGNSLVYANKLDPGKSWRGGWEKVGSSQGSGIDVTATASPGGFIVAASRTTGANIWHTRGTIGNWGVWSRVGSSADGGSQPAAITVNDDVILAIRGKSGQMLYNVWATDGGWRGWRQLGSTQAGSSPTMAKLGPTVMVGVDTSGPPATNPAKPPFRTS